MVALRWQQCQWSGMHRRDARLTKCYAPPARCRWMARWVKGFGHELHRIGNQSAGTIFDGYLLDVRKPLHYESWNSEKLRWAVQVKGTVDGKPGDKEWTSVIALPVEDVVTAAHIPPQPGDRWRINLYRIERLPIGAKLAWSPTFKDFHVPARFREIVFSDRTAALKMNSWH